MEIEQPIFNVKSAFAIRTCNTHVYLSSPQDTTIIAMRPFSRDVPFEIADCAPRPEFDLRSTYTRATRPRISSRFSFNVFHPQIRRQLWPSPLYLYTYQLARDELENYARSRRILWVNLPSIVRAASKSSVT